MDSQDPDQPAQIAKFIPYCADVQVNLDINVRWYHKCFIDALKTEKYHVNILIKIRNAILLKT